MKEFLVYCISDLTCTIIYLLFTKTHLNETFVKLHCKNISVNSQITYFVIHGCFLFIYGNEMH